MVWNSLLLSSIWSNLSIYIEIYLLIYRIYLSICINHLQLLLYHLKGVNIHFKSQKTFKHRFQINFFFDWIYLFCKFTMYAIYLFCLSIWHLSSLFWNFESVLFSSNFVEHVLETFCTWRTDRIILTIEILSKMFQPYLKPESCIVVVSFVFIFVACFFKEGETFWF